MISATHTEYGLTNIGDVKMKYPEHEKLKLIKDQSQIIGEFLAWLQYKKKISLCTIENDDYVGYYKRIEEILANYFDIDLNKIEKEKMEMLNEIRNANI